MVEEDNNFNSIFSVHHTKMYDDIAEGIDETVEINGFPFYPEEINGEESYNRRETKRTSIMNGTEHVARGKYICRRYSFTTYILIPEGRPDVHDEIFREMMSKTCEVISPYMGGKFKAEVVIQRDAEEATPEHLKLNVDITEVPEETSNIPGDEFIIPEDKLQDPNTKKESTESATETNNVGEAVVKDRKNVEEAREALKNKLKNGG